MIVSPGFMPRFATLRTLSTNSRAESNLNFFCADFIVHSYAEAF